MKIANHWIGERLRDHVLQIVSALPLRPDLGWPHHAGTRLQRVAGFPYGVIFLVKENCVQIVAVAHFSRRSDYWFDRVPR